MATSRNLTAGAFGKVLTWYRQRKSSARRDFVWNALSGLRPNQQLTAAQLFGSFRMQVASTLFADQQQMEQTLRGMQSEGLAEFDSLTQGWRLVKRPLQGPLDVNPRTSPPSPGQRLMN